MDDDGLLTLRPLTARSIVLSTLLGHHPPRLPVRALVRVGELFAVAEGTIRVALSRMVAAGDLEQDAGVYGLSARLLERQARQDDSRSPRTREWDGSWEIALVAADRRAAGERSALRQAMAGLRLAELREGSWLRPANLDRPHPPVVREQCTLLTGTPDGDPAALAAALWGLADWARRAGELEAALERERTLVRAGEAGLAGQFTVSAAVLRHLLSDPVLPAALLPPDWPGARLRSRYEDSQRELHEVLRACVSPGGAA